MIQLLPVLVWSHSPVLQPFSRQPLHLQIIQRQFARGAKQPDANDRLAGANGDVDLLGFGLPVAAAAQGPSIWSLIVTRFSS